MRYLKYSFVILFVVFISIYAPISSQANPGSGDDITLKIIYPSPNETIIINNKPVFLIGNIAAKNASLKINNIRAKIDEDGAFICYCPVILFEENGITKGKFIFEISTDRQDYTLEKIYKVKMPPRELSEEKLDIDSSFTLLPYEDILVQEGDYITVKARASRGAELSFEIEGISNSFPMVETVDIRNYHFGDSMFGDGFHGISDTVNGVYKGVAFIERQLKDAKITIKAKLNGSQAVSLYPKGKVSTMNPDVPLIAKTVYEPNLIIGRHGDDAGYFLFLDGDIKLEIIGKIGETYKARLGNHHSIFVNASSLNLLPKGTPPTNADVSVIRVSEDEKHAFVKFGFSERVPYRIVQTNDPQKLEVFFYNTTSSIDWVNYFRSSDFVKDVRHQQIEDGVIKVEIFLNQKTHWGYWPSYNNNTFELKINKPAKRNTSFLFWNNQLKNREIVLDPGHTPDNGAVGPRGIKEKDINLGITRKLQQLLIDSGANVYLTHEGEGLGLRERKAVVNSFKSEICISIHNNAVPQGVNAIVHNGTSAYYYYPQAKPLAEMIYKNLLKNIELPDFGFYWDNLYMCRIPECIAMLVEPAFMSIPEQERLLSDEDFQMDIAKSILESLQMFYDEYSE